jgi:hypothetical protein
VYSGFFTAFCPVRTTVGSTLGGILIEVDVVAYRGPDADAQVGH